MTTKSMCRGIMAVLAGAAAMLAGAPAQAQLQSPPKATQTDPGDTAPTRLILLGTAGGPIVRKLRSGMSSLLVVNGTPYMIDAGPGAQQRMAWTEFRISDIAALFITHHHMDHNADVVTLISSGWVQRRAKPMTIVGPYGTHDLTKAALDYFAASERIFFAPSRNRQPAAEQVVAKDIVGPGPMVVYQDANIKVTAVENTHYQTFDAGKDRSYSFRIDTAERSFVFSGDTGPSEALTELAKGADVLVSEVIDVYPTIVAASADSSAPVDMNSPLAAHMRDEHLTPEEVGKMAQAAGVKMVVLSHIAPGLDSETDMSRYRTGVQKFYKGPVVVGRDLLEL